MKHIPIVILDPNQVQANFLKYCLSSSGIKNTLLFHSLEECLYSIRKSSPKYIIAVTELKETTSLEFLDLMKNTDPSIKVIFYSDNEDILFISRLLDNGAADYIVKSASDQNWMHELTSNLQYLIKEEFLIK
jgi:DNA-binding NarL/FixJ family response regulator